MSRLHDEISAVLARADRALLPDDILESVTATRHASRVRSALQTLAEQGEAVESPEGAGWHRPGVVADVPKRDSRMPAYLIEPPTEPSETTEKPMSTKHEPTAHELRTLILELAGDGQEWTSADLADRLPAYAKKAIRNALTRMHGAGELERVRYGVYRKAAASKAPAASKASQPRRAATPRSDGTVKALTRHARTAREALDEYLDSLDDPVLSSLIDSATAAERALTTYRQRAGTPPAGREA